MLGIDGRAARSTWTAALVVLALWLVYKVRSTLFIFVLAVLFAYLLAPLVNLLDRFLPARRTRTLALALAYVMLVGLVILGGTLIGPRVVDQAVELEKAFPAKVQGWVDSFQTLVPDSIKAELAKRSSDVIAMLPPALLKFLTLASNLIYLVIIPVLAFFFLKDGRVIRQHILNLVEAGSQQALLDEVLVDVDQLLAHYMRALVLLSVGTFTAYSIFFSVLGVPYGILLGVLGGTLEFIPMVGPLAAAVIILVVAGVSGAPLLAILIFLVGYRMFQDYVASPHFMGQGVELHPVLVLFGVFAGAELAGIAGTFLSVPVLALARILYLRIYRARAAGAA
ncbi:MAG TPA: AI-2E family transporter [Bryobacteraceae bacterium]|nr:AI-2E family transporter [Bryobacteraceae bacterium]